MTRVSRRQFIGTAAAGSALAASNVTATAVARESALTLACADYVRFLPVAAGDVAPRGLTLTWMRGDRNEMMRRVTDEPAVDGGENSMAQHVMRVDRGDRAFVAVPVFPLRNFAARDLYTRRGGPTGRALVPRRLGIYNWAASGAVWYRHLLRHLGHDTTKISWVVGGPDGPATVRLPEPALPNVTAAPAGVSLSDMLLANQIDAFFAPLPPRALHPVDGPIVRVFPDFPAVEQQYFAATRCYPPQHVILLKRSAWERDRAVGRSLVAAFDECETRFEANQRLYPYNSPWLISSVEDAARLMGPAYHAHGLEKNRHAVDVFCQGAYDDGLTKRRVTVDEFFSEFVAAG